jgi:hypothetical protein
MAIAIIGAVLLAASAVTATLSLWGGAITGAVSASLARNPAGTLARVAHRASQLIQRGAKYGKLPTKAGKGPGQGMAKQLANLNTVTGSILSSGFTGITNLMKQIGEIKHGEDM